MVAADTGVDHIGSTRRPGHHELHGVLESRSPLRRAGFLIPQFGLEYAVGLLYIAHQADGKSFVVVVAVPGNTG